VSRGTAWLLAVAVAAATLVGCYVLAGGAGYKPAATPDPCRPLHWPSINGTSQLAQQVTLSALSGAACTLGVSREELTLAFADRGRLDQFARDHGFSRSRIDDAARAGLDRAIDDGRRSGAINTAEALVLRLAAAAAPIDRLIAYVRQGLA
jgi:hypothetical protein